MTDEARVLHRLSDRNITDNDLSASIDLAELLILTQSLPLLLDIVQDNARAFLVREQAAKTIAFLGAATIEPEIDRLLRGCSEKQLVALLILAKGKPKDHYF